MTDFPDYEVADDVLAEWEAHLVGQQPNPFTTGTQWTVQRIVDAALGDGPLYREATAAEWATGKIHSQDMPIVRVWPKGATDADA